MATSRKLWSLVKRKAFVLVAVVLLASTINGQTGRGQQTSPPNGSQQHLAGVVIPPEVLIDFGAPPLSATSGSVGLNQLGKQKLEAAGSSGASAERVLLRISRDHRPYPRIRNL